MINGPGGDYDTNHNNYNDNDNDNNQNNLSSLEASNNENNDQWLRWWLQHQQQQLRDLTAMLATTSPLLEMVGSTNNLSFLYKLSMSTIITTMVHNMVLMMMYIVLKIWNRMFLCAGLLHWTQSRSSDAGKVSSIDRETTMTNNDNWR